MAMKLFVVDFKPLVSLKLIDVCADSLFI